MSDGAAIQLVVRYDDFFLPRAQCARDYREIELEIARFHADERLAGVFAVVPMGLEEDAAAEPVIRALQAACEAGSEIALHGHAHENTLAPAKSRLGRWLRQFQRRTRGEFAGLPAVEQDARILEGKRRIESCLGGRVRSFVPPWNAYDAATVSACRAGGLTVLSASRAWPVPSCRGLSLIPQTVVPSELARAVALAAHRRNPVAIVCVTHVQAYRRDASCGGVALESWFDQLRAIARTPALQFTTLCCLHDAWSPRLDCRRLRRHRAVAALCRCGSAFAAGRTENAGRCLYPL